MTDKKELIVDNSCANLRLDTFISNKLEDFSRSRIKDMIDRGLISLNGKIVKPSKTVSEGDVVCVEIEEIVVADILPEDVPFDIVYEDDFFAIIDKPQGIVVHPTASMRTGTLVNGLMKRLDNLSGINGVLRPGIVHRIDKDTSGLLVVAKSDFAHKDLALQIQEKTCKRSYVALCEGVFKKDKGHIQTKIGRNPKNRKTMAVTGNGKIAITDFTVMKRYNKFTLVRFDLQTGRTHQIRVHGKHMGHPIVGDTVYGYLKQKFDTKGQLLHAEKLELDHPKTKERMTFLSPIPTYFRQVLRIIEENDM